MFNFITNSPAETIEFGRKIGSQLKGSEVIAVCGPLGSGKTHLIKGIAAGAGAADGRVVNSPTFVIVNEYAGRLDIFHIDAYRLNSIAEFEMLGFDDYCYPHSVVLIEWADKIESALKAIDYIRIELGYSGSTGSPLQITESKTLSMSKGGQTARMIHIKNTPIYMTL